MSVWGSDEEAALSAVERVAPVPRASKFSAWSAIPRGVAEAGAQIGASVAEFVGGYGQVLGAYPEAAGYIPTGEARKQADAARSKLLTQGVDLNNPVGDVARAWGRSLRPDPVDASMAEQVLYGFARGASKVVAGGVLAGPIGVAGAGLDEGMATADDLRAKGVGFGARAAAGAVQGAGLALAALPAAGQTLATTAALYAAGGPAGYIAQQALTREILQRNGYAQEAANFDPFDPVGLAVSALIPAPFAALGLRANRRAAGAARAPSEVTPVAHAAAEAMPREAVDAALVSHEVIRQQRAAETAAMFPERGTPVDSLATFVERGGFKAAEAPKPADGANGFLAWIKAQGGIDIGQKVDITGEANAVRSNPAGIFRRGGISTDDLASRAAAEGYLLPGQEGDSAALVDMVKRAINGERVLTLEQQQLKAERDFMAAQADGWLAHLEDRVRLLGEDPAAARGNVDALEAYLRANEHRLLRSAMDEIAAARGQDSPEFDALQAQAKSIARDVQDGGRTLPEFEAEVMPLSPVMRRLVEQEIARDAATAAQATQPQGSAAPRVAGEGGPAAGPADAGRPAAQVEAAGLTPGGKAESAAAAARVEQLRAEFPDMQVMLDGMDKPMRLDDFLAAVKAEADQMQADAPLLQVAAECALLNGG